MRLILHKYPYLSHRRGGEEILRPTPLQREKHENEDITVSFLEESYRVVVFFTIGFYGLLSSFRSEHSTHSTRHFFNSHHPPYFQITQQYLSTFTIIQTENMTSWATTCFGDQLLTKSGLQTTTEVLKGKKYVGLYFR